MTILALTLTTNSFGFLPDQKPLSRLLLTSDEGDRALGPDASAALVKTWLKKCESHGSWLCASQRDYDLPTRVIDVGHDTANHEQVVIKLVEPAQVKGRYICLSHCWGPADDPGASPLRTVTANRQEHLQQIPWNKLSKTFQHAIIITRKLDVRYIWIDSLVSLFPVCDRI